MKRLAVLLLVLFAAGTLHAQFVIGDSVMVILTTDCVNVRSVPSVTGSTVLKCEPAGMKGRVIGGPTVSSPYTFWQVTYTDGISGWSAGSYLTKVTPVTPLPPCPISTADSLRIFNLGFLAGKAAGIDSVILQIQGFKTITTLNDSTIVIKP